MKTNGLKRTVILRVFCQMRGETTQVFRKEIYEDQAFSVESFFTSLSGNLFEETVVSLLRIREPYTTWPSSSEISHKESRESHRFPEIDYLGTASDFRFWVVLSDGFQWSETHRMGWCSGDWFSVPAGRRALTAFKNRAKAPKSRTKASACTSSHK